VQADEKKANRAAWLLLPGYVKLRQEVTPERECPARVEKANSQNLNYCTV